jgi:hypothetical protein
MKIKLYINNEDVSEVLTEQERADKWQAEINDAIEDFKSGECFEVDMISDFCADKDYTPDKLIDCIFNPQKAEELLEEYRNYVTDYYQGFMNDYTPIEKEIQVEN